MLKLSYVMIFSPPFKGGETSSNQGVAALKTGESNRYSYFNASTGLRVAVFQLCQVIEINSTPDPVNISALSHSVSKLYSCETCIIISREEVSPIPRPIILIKVNNLYFRMLWIDNFRIALNMIINKY